jgi:putative DNA-invertase from lambdoid prophage Rac
MCKTFAYLRVSTDRQDLENQRMEILDYAARLGTTVDEWLEVEISSRKDMGLRRINELVSRLKKGDTLIVTELSRLARSMRETFNILGDLATKKVAVHIIKQNLITRGDDDVNTMLIVNAFSMAAQLERTLISQRTKNGLARVKAQGKVLGNPNLEAMNKVRLEQATSSAERLRGILTAFKGQGMTQRKMVEELNALELKTAQGCAWTLCAVQRTLKRLWM